MTDHHPPTKPAGAASDGRASSATCASSPSSAASPSSSPRPAREASRAIDALKRRRPEPVADRRREIRAVQDDMARGRGDGARVLEGVETTGYGSSATWKGGRVVTTVTETRRAGQTNERVELARYTVSAGERVIHGQRILGVVRLVDDPASGEGRRYVIERELDRDGRARGDRRRLPPAGRDVGRDPGRRPVLPARRAAGARADDRPPPPRPGRARRAHRAGPRDRRARRPLHRAPRDRTAAVRARPVRRRRRVRRHRRRRAAHRARLLRGDARHATTSRA